MLLLYVLNRWKKNAIFKICAGVCLDATWYPSHLQSPVFVCIASSHGPACSAQENMFGCCDWLSQRLKGRIYLQDCNK